MDKDASMSDLPLFPVYLAGVWPAASWYVEHILAEKRQSEREYPRDSEETARDAFLVALDDQLRVGADIVSTTLGLPGTAEDTGVLADLIRRTVDGIPLEVCLRLGYLDGVGRPMARRRYLPWLIEIASAVAAATVNVRQFDLAFGGVEMAEIELLAELPPRR